MVIEQDLQQLRVRPTVLGENRNDLDKLWYGLPAMHGMVYGRESHRMRHQFRKSNQSNLLQEKHLHIRNMEIWCSLVSMLWGAMYRASADESKEHNRQQMHTVNERGRHLRFKPRGATSSRTNQSSVLISHCKLHVKKTLGSIKWIRDFRLRRKFRMQQRKFTDWWKL